MKRLGAAILASCVLSGCGGSAAPAAVGNPAMLPVSSSGDLLYITSARKRHGSEYSGVITILTWPAGKAYATIPLRGVAAGLCADAAGNVWALVDRNNNWHAYEYAHGGTKPIAAIHIPHAVYGAPGCAIDPTSGDLAVLTGYFDGGSTHAYVEVWKGATPGKPAQFPLEFTPQACAYDGNGNLFVDGYVGSTVFFELAELADGSKAVKQVAIDEELYGYPGGVQWDGTYVDVISESVRSHGPAIFQLTISGSEAHVAGVIQPQQLYFNSPFAIAGNKLVATTGSSGQDVTLWKYPRGGKPVAMLAQFEFEIRGVAVSI